MKLAHLGLAVAVAGAALAGEAAGVARPRAPVLEQVADIPLPGPPVRFDYQSLDTATNRLYLSHMNAGRMLVFDLRARRVEGTVRDLPRVTGVCAVPSLGKIYASVPGRRAVAVIDACTLRLRARIGPIGFPDGLAYAPDERKIFVSDEAGGGERVIDGASDRALATIPIGGEAGNTIYDPVAHRILVAVQSRNEVVAVDPRSDRVSARHRLAGASRPHGMAIDPAARLLFVAGEANARLQVVDLRTMQVIGSHRVAAGPDVLAFDPGWQRLYVAAESGAVTVFSERDRHLVAEGQVAMAHAHSVAVDPRTHLVYVPLQDVGGRPVLRIMRARRP